MPLREAVDYPQLTLRRQSSVLPGPWSAVTMALQLKKAGPLSTIVFFSMYTLISSEKSSFSHLFLLIRIDFSPFE